LYYRYLLDPAGISLFGTDTLSEILLTGLAHQSFSPSGNLYVRLDAITLDTGQFISVFDVDRCAGILTLREKLHSPAGIFSGAAISPSDRFLYADKNDSLWQWDLHAADVQASRILIDTNKLYAWPGWFVEGFGPLINAIDGRIYLISSNGSSHTLSVIDRPDEAGSECRFLQNEIVLPVWTSRSPNNVGNYRIGPIDGSSCDTLGLNNHPVAAWRWEVNDTLDPQAIRFLDLSYFRPETYQWDFGDGHTADVASPLHMYELPGIYHVCLTVSNEYATDSLCRWVEIEDITALDDVQVASFTVYPNPFTDIVEIIPPMPGYQSYDLLMTDMFGRVLIQQPMTFPGRIKLNSAPPGVYFLALQKDHRLVWSTTLMKVE
jgi:hypothetical protein